MRRLTDEEEALWRRVTNDVTRATPRRRSSPSPQPSARLPVAAPPANPRAIPRVPAFLGGDPAMDRLVARRRRDIDRILDLHGYAEEAAHARFRRFVLDAVADGARIALIITGKGAPSDDADYLSARRGVLKRRFRDWIEEPALRVHIARAAPAHPRDGGAGAFYLFLKSRRQSGGR